MSSSCLCGPSGTCRAIFCILSDLILPLTCFAASSGRLPPSTLRRCLSIPPLRPDGFRLSLGCDRGEARQTIVAPTTRLHQPPRLAKACFKVVGLTGSCHPVFTPWDGISALSNVKQAINFESRLGLILAYCLRVESLPTLETSPPSCLRTALDRSALSLEALGILLNGGSPC
jgi:hypothetical protein